MPQRHRTRCRSSLARAAALSCLAPLAAISLTFESAVAGSGRSGRISDDDRESLEEYLARLRTRESRSLDDLRRTVTPLLAELSRAIDSQRVTEIERARNRLSSVGPSAAPLLVESIDPGEAAPPAARKLADEVTRVLAAQPMDAVADDLVAICRTGSLEGRLHAIRLLGGTSDPERVDDVLALLFESSNGVLRGAALAAMARLGGPTNQARLHAALSDQDPALVRVALDALADARSTGAADAVLALTRRSSRASRNVPSLVAYYRACRDVVDETHAEALVGLAADGAVGTDERVLVLELLPEFEDEIDGDARDRLEALAESPSRELREGALVCLSVLGDRGAKRDLLADYNRQVSKNKTYAKSYESRAVILYRIGEYREAVRDYKEALRLGPGDFRSQQVDAHVGLARCYARMGKLKDASQTLRRAPISSRELRGLADDPAFEELRDSKYGDVFGIGG